MPKSTPCETCTYYEYNSDTDSFDCMVNFDEDEVSMFYTGGKNGCPYYHFYDEYKMVQKQN